MKDRNPKIFQILDSVDSDPPALLITMSQSLIPPDPPKNEFDTIRHQSTSIHGPCRTAPSVGSGDPRFGAQSKFSTSTGLKCTSI